MNGSVMIGIGIIIMTAGTICTLRGQYLNDKEDTRKLMQQNAESDSLLQNIGNSQLRASMFTSSLDEPVKSVYVRLALHEEKMFSEVCPLELAFEILKFDSIDGDTKSQTLRFVVHGDPLLMSSGSNEFRLEQFIVERYFDDSADTLSTSIGKNRKQVTEISIPLLYHGSEKNLIYKVRDFHKSIFKVYIQDSLLIQTRSIELVVNGWAILRSDPNQVSWSSEKIKWDKPKIDTEFKTAYTTDSKGNKFPESAWYLNIYSIVPDYLGDW